MKAAAVPGADERTVNEVCGFFFRLSTQSAAHMTDYVVDAGTVQMMGGANTEALVRICLKTGLLARTRVDGLPAYKLLDDPEFIHIRLRSEVEWERQQRADTSDVRLAVPVRARDGDTCRYCAVPVQWLGRTTGRKGTLDHLEPGQPATVDTLVVACKSCNSELRDADLAERKERLRPVPEIPFYTRGGATWLTKNGRPTAPTDVDDVAAAPRPGSQPDTAQRPGSQPDTATSSADDQTGLRPGAQPDTAPTAAASDPAPAPEPAPPGNVHGKSPPKSFGVTAGMSSAGSGRAGSGVARVPGTGAVRGKRSRRRRGGGR